jgi:hypothetical protein
MKDEGRETKDEIVVHRPSRKAAIILHPSFIKLVARNTKLENKTCF